MTEQPHADVILSINVMHGAAHDSGVVAMLSARVDGTWSEWFRMLTWGLADHAGVETSATGRVETDQLHLHRAATSWCYSLVWRTKGAQPLIRRVALCFAGAQQADESPKRSAWGKRLDVPFLSQWSATKHIGQRVCSPTSVAMIACFYGHTITVDEVATLAYDPGHDIYGNWPLNMLAASQLGLRAVVDRGDSLLSLENAIASGEPVVTSIAYGHGELPGAPQESSAGHLVVVAGFTRDGDVLVRDPAAKGDDIWLTYPRSAFEKGWLEHGGVMYRISPERAP